MSGALWRRLAVTVALPLVIELLARVMLPGIDSAALGGLSGLGLTDLPPTLGVLALGIVPILSAFVLVELATLVVPAWRPLRTGGIEGRARLQRGVVIVTLLLAMVQAYSLVLYLDQLSWQMPELVPHPGAGFRLVVGLTLIAGMTVTWLAAVLIDRYGLGNGFSVLIASALAVEILDQLGRLAR